MMNNLKITVFVLCVVSAFSLRAENRFETLCWDAMVDMTNQYSVIEKINNAEVYRWVDDNYVYKHLKNFLKKNSRVICTLDYRVTYYFIKFLIKIFFSETH